MQFHVFSSPDNAPITVRLSGTPDLVTIIKYTEAAFASAAWRPGHPVLCDLRDVDVACFSHKDIVQLAALHGKHSERSDRCPLAVVVSRHVDYGIIRMWLSYTREHYPIHHVFYNIETARGWLQTVMRVQTVEAPAPK